MVALLTTTKATKEPLPTTKVTEMTITDQPTSQKVITPKAKVMDTIPMRMTEATTSLVKLLDQPLKMAISLGRPSTMISSLTTPSPSPSPSMKKKRSTSTVPTRSLTSKLQGKKLGPKSLRSLLANPSPPSTANSKVSRETKASSRTERPETQSQRDLWYL